MKTAFRGCAVKEHQSGRGDFIGSFGCRDETTDSPFYCLTIDLDSKFAVFSNNWQCPYLRHGYFSKGGKKTVVPVFNRLKSSILLALALHPENIRDRRKSHNTFPAGYYLLTILTWVRSGEWSCAMATLD